MSISMNAMGALYNTTAGAANAVANASSQKVQTSLNGISKDSSDEELLQVCKDFESYFVEELLKEVKENMKWGDDKEDSALSTLTDFHMDSTIELLADELVDEIGGNFTQQLFEQMKRNYNLD